MRVLVGGLVVMLTVEALGCFGDGNTQLDATQPVDEEEAAPPMEGESEPPTEEPSYDPLTGVITGWVEDSDTISFDSLTGEPGTGLFVRWTKRSTTSGGYFDAVGEHDELSVAKNGSIGEITDASSLDYHQPWLKDLEIGGIGVLRNERTGMFGAVRFDNFEPNPNYDPSEGFAAGIIQADVSWFFTGRSDDFSTFD